MEKVNDNFTKHDKNGKFNGKARERVRKGRQKDYTGIWAINMYYIDM
jgi:hypothetical protein